MNAQSGHGTLGSRLIGEIAATLPGATAVFRKFALDFCCGGDVALADAARSRSLDLAEIERDLARLNPSVGKSAAPEATRDLIDHILTRYHEIHRRELPELIGLARKVEAVHAEHAKVPRGLARLLQEMSEELESHMAKEELILFPAMRNGAGGVLAAPIARMRLEHDDHGAQLQRIEAITGGLDLPGGACRSWQALYDGVAKLVDDLMEHIHLENNVLFPRFEDHRAA